VERDDEPDRHVISSRTLSCFNQYHDPPAAVTRKDIALFRHAPPPPGKTLLGHAC